MTFASIPKVTKFEVALNSFIKSLEEISNHSHGRTNVRKYKCDVNKVVAGMLEALHGVGHPNEAEKFKGGMLRSVPRAMCISHSRATVVLHSSNFSLLSFPVLLVLAVQLLRLVGHGR